MSEDNLKPESMLLPVQYTYFLSLDLLLFICVKSSHRSCSSYSWVDLELTNAYSGLHLDIPPLQRNHCWAECSCWCSSSLPRENWTLVSLVLECGLAKLGDEKVGGIDFPGDETLKQT